MPALPAPVLKVIAVPGRLMFDDLAAQANLRRYAGRVLLPVANEGTMDDMYPPEARSYPDDGQHKYIIRAVKKGDLIPCDEYTARRCGVPLKLSATA